MSSLRPYQTEAVGRVIDQLRDVQSTLLVMATGLGKTRCAAELIRKASKGKVMFTAHRQELVFQAAKTIEKFARKDVEIEMGDLRVDSWDSADVTVASIQSLNAGRVPRMNQFNPTEYSLFIGDEIHHYTAKSFRRVLDYFKQNPNMKFVGLSATPQRGDEEALGQIMDSVAFEFHILDGIDEGWLCPVRQQLVTIEGLDYSKVRTTAGDLNSGDLARVMVAEENIQGVTSATLDIIGDRRTIIFATTVRQAEKYAEIFNRHRSGMADFVCGKTPDDTRFNTFRRFANGDTQVLANVGITIEGYDNPEVECIVMAAPTKVKSRYIQMAGRATRTLPGLVDGLGTAEERRLAIDRSRKPSCEILDFVGNSGRHKLITTGDILGGNVSPEALEIAKARAKNSGAVDMRELVEEAEEERRRQAEEQRVQDTARRARLVAEAKYSLETVDPFQRFGLHPPRVADKSDGRVLSDKQTDFLLKRGINPSGITYNDANRLIRSFFGQWKKAAKV